MSQDNRSSTDYFVNVATYGITLPDGSPATPEVLNAALLDTNSEVVVCAALSLVELGDLRPAVIDILFEESGWSNDPDASSAARYGIVELAQTNPLIVDLLVAALHKKTGSLCGVAECLGEIGQASPAVIDGLLVFSQQSNDSYAVACALYSLLQLGYEASAIIDHLQTLRKEGDVMVRIIVRRAFRLLKHPPTEIAEDGQIRIDALRSLGTLPNPTQDMIDNLCTALSNQKWAVRRKAIESLARLGKPTPHVIASLLNLLADETEKDQARISHSTQHPSTEEEEDDVRVMLAMLMESQSLRGTAAIALAQLGCINDAVIATFWAELGDENASVRERIVRNWWLLGTDIPAALDALQSALQDESEMVRQSAAVSLARLA